MTTDESEAPGPKPATWRAAWRGRAAEVPPAADILEDATLVALAAVHIAVKNVVIVRTLRDRADHDDGFYLAAIRQELAVIAAQTEHDAARVSRSMGVAASRRGRGQHPSDYRVQDVPTLERRRATLVSLAHRLRLLGTDDARLHTILDTARLSALDEITAASPSAQPSRPLLRLDGEQRAAALLELAADLRVLAARAADRTHPPDGS